MKDIVAESAGGFCAGRVLHWYDFLCPFCYVGQQRNSILAAHGFEIVDLPFQAHPEIPPGGRLVGPRGGAINERIKEEARASGLPLVWPDRLPDTRMALAASEWVRQRARQSFSAFEEALFAAHFALGENLGDRNVIDRHAVEAGVDVGAMHAALESGLAYRLVDRAEALGRQVGVQGTPAWLIEGRLVPALHPRGQFKRLAEAFAP